MGFLMLFIPVFIVGYVVWVFAKAAFEARDAWRE